VQIKKIMKIYNLFPYLSFTSELNYFKKEGQN